MYRYKIILQTVVETPEFIRQAASCMEEEARTDFIKFIAENPLSGEVISATGGARKVRWQADANKGKRGGIRIIYYYHDTEMPIFLFTAYKKNKKENITDKEKAALKKIIHLIVDSYEENNHE